MRWAASLVAAALATLAHPRWWVVALAGFLVRGGVLVVLLPIVVPPTVASVMSQLAPTIVGQVVVGGPNAPVLLLAGVLSAAIALFAWIAGTLGASFDAELVADAIDDDDLGLDVPVVARTPPGLGTARLGPHVVTCVVFALATVRIFDVMYVEATSPGAPTTPFLVRVASQTSLEIGAVVVALLLAEAVGGLALRTAYLDPAVAGAAVPRAIGRAVVALLQPRAVATLVATTFGVVVAGLPGGLAASRAWAQVRLVFAEPAETWAMAVALLLFIGVVLGWLTLLGVALAWRSAAWTAISAPTVTRPSPLASEASR